MSTYLDWFKTIAFALNDDEPHHEFTRYPLSKMVDALNAAMCMVYKYRPDLFTEWAVVKLQPGKYQDVRACCDVVLTVADQTTADGAVVKPLDGGRETQTKVRRLWRKPTCIAAPSAPGGFTINNVSIDANMNGRFTVDPPVPRGTDAYVRVKCVSKPCALTEAGVNACFNGECDQAVAAWHFVIARMLTGDRFSQGANADMQYHYKMFFEMLGVVQRQEDRIQSTAEALP